jgi:protein phosphatase methylesterase 1
MSDLHKAFAKSKLAKLPPEAPLLSESSSMNHPAESSHDEDSSSVSSAGTVIPSPSRQLFARASQGSSESSSLSWSDFFTQELFLTHETDTLRIVHHVYLTPPTDSGPLFVMHHGAGSSGLSFATCAEEIRKILPKAGILSLDARDHGRTSVQRADGGAPELDLSLGTLNQDLVYVLRKTQAEMGWEELPDLVLVGHSLGGAVITDVAKKGELGNKLLAYAVLDVVEGMISLSISRVVLTRMTQGQPWMPSKAWRNISRLGLLDSPR